MKARYRRLTDAISDELVVSSYPVTQGGLGVAFAKVAMAGRIGMEITIPGDRRPDCLLFSETLGRFIVTVAPDNKQAFERAMGTDAILSGRVGGTTLKITGKTAVAEGTGQRT